MPCQIAGAIDKVNSGERCLHKNLLHDSCIAGERNPKVAPVFAAVRKVNFDLTARFAQLTACVRHMAMLANRA